jgi:hypothetical protein
MEVNGSRAQLDCEGNSVQISSRPSGVRVLHGSMLSPGSPSKTRFLGDSFRNQDTSVDEDDELERLREQQQFLMLRQEQEELIRLQQQQQMMLLLKRRQGGPSA